ncbi:uncharacterized protein LOC108436852 [Pygocentrus nattereri]|uniref:uncharacterized protein LOC108436852 n=1 Tax=Pygocentrus nattereri TaxID=42514 RepID=UPI001891C4A0|nr:uncharacterized protein LOC108436852 [Pygocentrus nattereri]
MIQIRGIIILCIVADFHQALRERQVTGFIGHSVILKSGVDPSWKLDRVQWSIYTNTTYIAIFENGKVEIRSSRYMGRLSLHKSSGDLEIKELKADDGMRYTVSLLSTTFKQQDNHISFTVLEHLRTPNLTVLSSSLIKEDCKITLKCSSLEDNVTLSWTPEDGFNEPLWIRNNSRKSVLWTSFTPNRNVTFTCTATDGHCGASAHLTVQCPGESKSGTSFSVFSLLSSLMAASPYLLVSIVLTVKCCRAQAKPDELNTV